MKKLFFIAVLFNLVFTAFAQQRVSQPKTKAEILNEKYCSTLFSTPHGDYFDLLDDKTNASAISYLNILEWLKGRVAGLQVYSSGNHNTLIPFIRNQRASIYVDEMWVNYDYLNSLPVADIAMIKIIKGPFIGSWGGAGGTIAIYTIRGDEEEPDEEP